MNPRLRRLAYAAAILVWLLVMAFPVFAFVLVSQGQIEVGDMNRSGLRVFLVQEADLQGVGFQRARPIGGGEGLCTRTSVSYLLWEGQVERAATSYCQCYDAASGYVTALTDCRP